MVKQIIIDTDPGIDDALAILLALASPELSLEGLSIVHGNCSLEQATKNGLSVLELAKASHIPLARGCELPLVQPSLLAPETHGNTGLGYAKLPEPRIKPTIQHGSDFLIEKVMSDPGEITIVAVGPLTNVAMALRKEPNFAKSVKELIIMGGAIRHEGNTTALAEFNVYVDPHAAHIVFHAGIPTTLVPLDVTYKCVLTAQDVER
ncbi:MAG TPA: nucleoside hydrolase, partial [Anaerolineae bacterium]|nr:nucleoside hydrolase [Anaerolineae bacterium]